MCTKYHVCGQRHLARWKTSKKLRDRKGRFIRNTALFKVFFTVMIVYAISMIGVNTIARTIGAAFKVEDTKAEEPIKITWQDEVMGLVRKAGINEQRFTNLVQCESSWNPSAIHYNRGSIDRGLLQINNISHSEVSKSCALDPVCATREAIRILKTKGFGEWVCGR